MGEHRSTARAELGAADVDDTALVAMAARSLARPAATIDLVSSCVSVVPYDLSAITTAGRWWVDATFATTDGEHALRWFVKVVQSWSRSPEFQSVPEAVRAFAEGMVPWRTEALVYRTDLRDRLPHGLTMPRADAVIDLDERSAALWIEAVPAVARVWDDHALVDAARRLGRLAVNPAVAELAAIGDPNGRFTAAGYRDGRLRMQLIPLLQSEEVWHHPVVAATFDAPLRDRLCGAAARIDDYVDELVGGPQGTAHGDACPNNLLTVAAHDDVVLIDFGFWSRQPLGFDLGQLMVGEVQLGRRDADTSAALDPAVVDAYAAGMADEGVAVASEVVGRLHAVQMLVYAGLSAIPIDLLDRPVDVDVLRPAHQRAELARFILDRVDATA